MLFNGLIQQVLLTEVKQNWQKTMHFCEALTFLIVMFFTKKSIIKLRFHIQRALKTKL